MPEDLDFKELFDALDEVPGLVETAKKLEQKDQANAKKIEAICNDVSSMKEEFSSLKTSINEAKNTFSKPVNIQDRNIHITKDDIRITQQVPGWVQDMGNEYSELKRQALSKKERKSITIGGPKFSTVMLIIISILFAVGILLFFLSEHQRNNGAEAYAERAYNAAVSCDYDRPGDYYFYVRNRWSNKDEDIKGYVSRLEKRAKFRNEIKAVLSPYYEGKEIVIDATEYKDNEIVVLWHIADEEPDYIAHFWPNGRVDVADAKNIKITSLSDARRLSKHKAWTTIIEEIPTEQVK